MSNELITDLESLPSPSLEDLPSPPKEYDLSQQAKDFSRTLAQGATLGFSDEAIAAARSLLESKPYEETVAEERAAVEKYAEAHPGIAFGAEVAGGVLPALLTGGASIAATGGKTALQTGGKLALKELAKRGAMTGALAGGIQAVGKSEAPITDIGATAKEAAVGAVSGGLVGGLLPVAGAGLKAGAKAITPEVEFSPRIRQFLTSIEEGKKGKGFTGRAYQERLAQETEAATDLSKRILDTKDRLGKQIETALSNADEQGVRIASNESIAPIAQDLEELATSSKVFSPEDRAKVLEGLEALKEGSLTPSKANELRRLLKETAFEFATDKEKRAVLNRGHDVLKQQLDLVPSFKEANQSYTDFLKTTAEPIISKGRPAEIAQGFLSDVGKQKEAIFDNLKDIIEKSELPGTVGKDQKQTLIELANRMAKIEEEKPGFLKSVGFDPDQFLQDIKKQSDLSSITKSIHGVEPRSTVKAESLGAPTGRGALYKAGYYTGKALGAAEKVAEAIPDKISASKPAQVARSVFNLPSDALNKIPDLVKKAGLKDYGNALEQALSSGDNLKKNSVLFALMQNPNTRKEIVNTILPESLEVEGELGKKQTSYSPEETKLPSPSGSRSPASEVAQSPSEDYTQKRFEFITGLEGKRKSEGQHVVYRDASESRNPTVGYGFNLNAPGNRELFKQALNSDDSTFDRVKRGELSISEKQAQKLFNVAADKAGQMLDQKLASEGIDSSILSENQRLALESLVYNSPALLGPKILSALKQRDMDKVAKLIEITSHQSGLGGLIKRRAKEAELFASE